MMVEDLLEELRRLPLTARVVILDGRVHRTLYRVIWRGVAVLELDDSRDDDEDDE